MVPEPAPETGDVFDTFDTHETHVAVPARRVRGMTLLDEAESEFGKLQVLRVDADATGADAPFAGAVVLMREHTPDAVLSGVPTAVHAERRGRERVFAFRHHRRGV